MQPAELKEKLSKIKMWQRGGERAPHKPLLLLYALGRLSRSEPRLMSYEEVNGDLKNLLIEFGPFRTTYSPEYPFVRLTNDGIWNINGLETLNTKKDWTERELIANHTLGGFAEPVYDSFKNYPALIQEIASNLLRQNFPDTIHQDKLFLGHKINIGYKNGLSLNKFPFEYKGILTNLADVRKWNEETISARNTAMVNQIVKMYAFDEQELMEV